MACYIVNIITFKYWHNNVGIRRSNCSSYCYVRRLKEMLVVKFEDILF